MYRFFCPALSEDEHSWRLMRWSELSGCRLYSVMVAQKLSCGTPGEPKPVLFVCFRATLDVISDGGAPLAAWGCHCRVLGLPDLLDLLDLLYFKSI